MQKKNPRLTGDMHRGQSRPLQTRGKLDFPYLQDDLDEMSISGTPDPQLATRMFIEDDSEDVDTTYSMIVSCSVQMTPYKLILLTVRQTFRGWNEFGAY